MAKITIKAEKRTANEKLNLLRIDGLFPAVAYGKWAEPIVVKLSQSEFLKTYRKAGQYNIITLDVEWEKVETIVHDFQLHPVTWDFLHVDFMIISKENPVTAKIPLVKTGESKAIKAWNMLHQQQKVLKVKCLAKDLVNEIKFDIAKLEEAGDNIAVRDLDIDTKKFKVLDNEFNVIASAVKLRWG